MSLSPASSVRMSTLPRTGSVLRDDTARLTTDRPRARFSCITETFTSGSLQGQDGSPGAHPGRSTRHRLGAWPGAPAPRVVWWVTHRYLRTSSSPSCGGRRGRRRVAAHGPVVDRRGPVVDGRAPRWGGPADGRWTGDGRPVPTSPGPADPSTSRDESSPPPSALHRRLSTGPPVFPPNHGPYPQEPPQTLPLGTDRH